jgi:hypothetical protein
LIRSEIVRAFHLQSARSDCNEDGQLKVVGRGRKATGTRDKFSGLDRSKRDSSLQSGILVEGDWLSCESKMGDHVKMGIDQFDFGNSACSTSPGNW